jgi:membrane protein YdbS with pleckstrin-like domain
MLPIICFLCVKDKKEALLKSLLLLCLAVLIGSYVIPEQSKMIWHYLENGRYFVLGIILVFEFVAISTVYLAIKTALVKREDPDISIAKPINKHFGDGIFGSLLCFETRMWTFALFANRINLTSYHGECHFTYHKKDGAQSNLFGFILLIVFEIPIVHLLLFFIWSPLAANVLTLLTILSLVFFIAEYRAVSKRPISLNEDSLLIRYGLYQPFLIPLNNIKNISKNNEFIKRANSVKRYNYAGTPNVMIQLIEPIGNIKQVYLGVDDAQQFITAISDKVSAHYETLV